MAAPLPLGTKRIGTKAAKDAAKCRRFATGFRNDIQPPPVVFQNVRNKCCTQKKEKNIQTEKEDICSTVFRFLRYPLSGNSFFIR